MCSPHNLLLSEMKKCQRTMKSSSGCFCCLDHKVSLARMINAIDLKVLKRTLDLNVFCFVYFILLGFYCKGEESKVEKYLGMES